jgi:molybdopterin-guanine dinucleotide biosynthesis protein A
VPASLLGELRRVAEATGADAAVPERDAVGRVEPLCAYYALPCGAAAARRIARGELRVAGLFEDVRVERLSLARVLDWGDPERLFLNVNTPAELETARRFAPADPREAPPP